MNRKIAFDNRLCYEREVLRQHALHQAKLQTVLPTCQSPSKVYLDSSAPPRRAHLATNRKKMQLERERQTEIFTQNQRLAAKMEQILNRQENVVLAAATPTSPTVVSPREGDRSPKRLLKAVHSPAYVHMPGIRLDSSQTPMVDCYLSPEFAMGRGNACKKDTLVNRGVQRQKQQRIEEENKRMKDRLKAQKPYYNTKKWDAEWQQAGIKFQHLHQNTTVGHLLPKPQTTSRSPLVARRVKTRDGLPSLKPNTNPGISRGGRLQQRFEARQQSGDSTAQVLSINHEEEDDEPEIVEFGAFVLLEATTRKGVEITVEELQIEMRDPATDSTQPGDRGVVVRGRWGPDVEGECEIGIDMLSKIAQEIDDLEMMIKLETISTLAGQGNFPRLSSLLTEDELQRLLFKLVQVLNVKVLESERQLVITSRLLRSPSPTGRDDKARPSCRPRTCPSVLPSEHHLPPEEVSADKVNNDDEAGLYDSIDEETHQYHRALCKQLAIRINDGPRRIGLRCLDGSFVLVRYWLHVQDTEIRITRTSIHNDTQVFTNNAPLELEQAGAMLEQIQNHSVDSARVVEDFIQAWLMATCFS